MDVLVFHPTANPTGVCGNENATVLKSSTFPRSGRAVGDEVLDGVGWDPDMSDRGDPGKESPGDEAANGQGRDAEDGGDFVDGEKMRVHQVIIRQPSRSRKLRSDDF